MLPQPKSDQRSWYEDRLFPERDDLQMQQTLPALMEMIPRDVPSPEGLRKLREGLGLSQHDLAVALGMKAESGATIIRRWEHDAECAPRSTAWCALRYLVILATIYRQMDLGRRAAGEIREVLPEKLK